MNKKINTSSIDDNVQFVKVADSTFVDLDYFSSIEHCVATNKNLNNCYIFYNDAKAILVSIEAKAFFKYALFLSDVQLLNDDFKKNDCFLTSVSRILHKDFGVQWIAQTPTHCIYKELPDGAEAIPFATYRLDLSRSEEELFSQLNS